MVIERVQIYPHGKKRKVYTKELNITKNNQNVDLLDYINSKYLELFKVDANIEKIASCVLSKMMELTNSKDGFIALLTTEDDASSFQYYTAYIEIAGRQVKLQTDGCGIGQTESLLTYGIINKCIIITNAYTSDPRALSSKKFPEQHPQINTFMAIPLIFEGKYIGEIGLSGADAYVMKHVKMLLPFRHFLNNFIYLWKNGGLNATRGIKLQKEMITLKDSFIATMSHEIRTPLNGIVGMVKLLTDNLGEQLTEKQQKYMSILTDCSTQLMELVNDILDFSKMSAGNLVLQEYPFNIKKCVNKVIDIISQRIYDKNLKLIVDISDQLPDSLTGDSRRLKQVLFNLLTNAIKFTETGYIKLSVTNEKVDKKCQKLIFKIEDTGIGISLKDQTKIFEIFTKLSKDDQIYSALTPGAGMGLAICKYIIEGMNGKIKVYSDGKNGSCFEFYVILEDEKAIQELLDEHEHLFENKLVIIVDDKEDNRIFLVDTLYSCGLNSFAFSSAREALNYIQKNKTFDLAIVDLCMPHTTGLEFVQDLRERNYIQPVIGLSSIGEDIPGKDWFDYFTTKPISKNQLLNLVLKCFLNNDGTCRIRPEYNSNRRLREHDSNLQIIVAEDDYYNQVVMTELLKDLGYSDIKIVSNGKQCVEEIKNKQYDVCLMDIKMPVMDGLQATKLIKKLMNPPTIIAVSASVLDAEKNNCYVAGIDGYISKPIQKDQLAGVLNTIKAKIIE